MEKSFLLSRGDLQVPCKLDIPNGGEVRRIVLGVHGFGGSTEDAIQTGIAQEMQLFRAATVRFDFPCHGVNPTDELTLEGCTASLLAAAEFAREQFPNVEDLCIFATGFGAYITLICLPELLEMPGKLKLVIQTPSVMMHETLLSMARITKETLWAMERFTMQAPRPFDVTYQFYEQLRDNFALATYPIPMLILQGEGDDFIRMEDIRRLRRINEDAKLVIIPGTSHRFLEDGAWDMVLDLTRDWFECEQVLITDWE